MNRAALALFLFVGATATGCGGCFGPPPGPGPLEDAGTVAPADDAGGEELDDRTLVIAPTDQEAFVDELASFSAFLEDDEGQRENVTGEAEWSLEGDDGFVMKAAGVVLVEAAGSTEVIASLADQEVRAELTGRARDADVVGLSVEPAPLEIPAGVSLNVRCVALYSDGQSRDVTTEAEWSSLDELTVSVAAAPDGVALYGEQEGTATVRVSFAGQTLEVDATVFAAPLVDVELVPATPVVPEGASVQLIAVGRYADGELFDLTSTVSWSSSDEGVFTVSGGLITGVAEGSADVTARADADAIERVAPVQVTGPDVIALDVTPAFINIAAGASARVRATAVLTDDVSIDVTDEALWTLDDEDAVLLTGGAGAPLRVEGVYPASTTLTAEYAGRTRSIDIVIADATLELVELLPDDVTLPAGTIGGLAFIGTWSDGSRADLGPDAVWTTSDADVVLVDANPPGRLRALSPGTATITASAGGLSDQITVTVTDAELVSLQLTPPIVTFPVGEETRLNAIGVYSDNTQRGVNFEATFETADEAVATVSNALGQKGVVTAVAAGITTITATIGDLSDTAEVTITDATVENLFITPPVVVVHPSFFEQAQAFATYSDGTTLAVTDQAVWESLNPAIARVSNAAGEWGRISGLSQGQAQVDATFGGVTASVNVFVTTQGFDNLVIWPFQDLSLALGMSSQLALIGVYAQNNDVTENLTPWAVWESSDPSVASVDNWPLGAGRVTAQSPGSAVISATYQGTTVQKVVVVTDAVLESLEISPPDVTLPVDAVQPFVAFGTFSDGEVRDVTYDASFTSDDNAIVTVVDNFIPGLAIALAPGTTDVRATLGDVETTTQVTVIDAVPTDLIVTPNNPIVNPFEQTRFYATALYDDGTEGDVSYLCSWSSDDSETVLVFDEPAAKGMGFPLRAGSATVAATCLGLTDDTLVTVR
jgi:uncharacterized protein YjdB